MTAAFDGLRIRNSWQGLASRLSRRWRVLSLAKQFLIAGGSVALVVMFLIGLLVTSLIERAVTRNAAATTALYVDSVIAPLLPDLQQNTVLTDPVKRALDETLGHGALGNRLVAMRIWSPDGTILYAMNDALVGQRMPLTPQLQQAAAGRIEARYDPTGTGSGAASGSAPLLAIYNPLLQPWSGEVVAMMEFYELADELHEALAGARLRSWLAVAAATLIFFLLLSAIVLRGSRTIDDQGRRLSAQVSELKSLLAANEALQARVGSATQRATALNESFLRRLGADLHDGPAQLIAFAALRLDSEALLADGTSRELREREIGRIRASLADGLSEIRTICRGLVLPQIEEAGLADVIARAVNDYEQRTGATVERHIVESDLIVPLSQRICAYRFVQEALNNGHRHCRGAPQSVRAESRSGRLQVTVSDRGSGFDPEKISPGSIGIVGMRDRIESLGGRFDLRSSPEGTKVSMSFELE